MSQYKVGPEYSLVTTSPTELKEYLKSNRGRPFRVLYQCRVGSVLDNWRKVGVLAYATGDMLVCIDEIGMLCEYGSFAIDKKGSQPILAAITHYGRHRKIQVIATAQRPTDIARRFTALCTEVRIFQTNEPKDLTYIQATVGQSAAERIAQLPKFAFLHWSDKGVEVYQPKLEG